MNPEQLFAQPMGGGAEETADGAAHRRGSVLDVDDELAVLLDRLERVRIGPMSRPQASRALDLLGRVRAVAESKMCDVARVVSETDSESDPAEVLRAGCPPSGSGVQEDGPDGATAVRDAQRPGEVLQGRHHPQPCQRSGQRRGEGRSREGRSRPGPCWKPPTGCHPTASTGTPGSGPNVS